MPSAELWVEAFAWTLWIEVPIYLWALKKTELSFSNAFSLSIGVNVFTHPALWYLFPRFAAYWIWLLVAECLVSLTEGLLIGLATSKMKWSIVLAFGVNAVSTLVGLFVL